MPRTSPTGLTPAAMRAALGEGFTLDMPLRVQEQLDLDILVMDIEGDAYSLQVAQRHVIIVKRTATWSRQNFSLAHELAHVASRHFTGQARTCDASEEGAANAYAAELLMPEDVIGTTDWQHARAGDVAAMVWDLGVSTEALRNRINNLGQTMGTATEELLELNTFKLLRTHWGGRHRKPDQITARRERAAARTIPPELVTRLEARVAEGTAPPESLAFALDVPVDEVDAAMPSDDTIEDDLALLRELAGR